MACHDDVPAVGERRQGVVGEPAGLLRGQALLDAPEGALRRHAVRGVGDDEAEARFREVGEIGARTGIDDGAGADGGGVEQDASRLVRGIGEAVGGIGSEADGQVVVAAEGKELAAGAFDGGDPVLAVAGDGGVQRGAVAERLRDVAAADDGAKAGVGDEPLEQGRGFSVVGRDVQVGQEPEAERTGRRQLADVRRDAGEVRVELHGSRPANPSSNARFRGVSVAGTISEKRDPAFSTSQTGDSRKA